MDTAVDEWVVIWDDIPDPRTRLASVQHSLGEIFLVLFTGLACGLSSIHSIERWAEHQLEWFRKFYPYKDGVPSHDTMTRVLGRVKPAAMDPLFKACFFNLDGFVIALDGKTSRGSRCADGSVVHIVQAVVAETRRVLGQQVVALKSNEITALPKLIEALNLKGAVVTMDAMGTQHAILEKIVKQKADAVLALKSNQSELSDACKTLLDSPPEKHPVYAAELPTEKGHGRVTSYTVKGCGIRKEWKGPNTAFANWASLGSVFVVATESMNTKTRKVSFEKRYFATTQECKSIEDIVMFADQVRKHWSVEVVHHDLDVLMKEDGCIVRERSAAQNLGLFRRVVLNHLREVEIPETVKLKNSASMKQRMEMALWSEEFRSYLLMAF